MGLRQNRFRRNRSRRMNPEDLRRQFALFRAILDRNNRILSLIGDLEEKSQGEYLFDLIYIRRALEDLLEHSHALVDLMISLGGSHYDTLQARLAAIESNLLALMPEGRSSRPGPLTLLLKHLNRTHSSSTGTKNARLGELSVLGIPVPSGFAITTSAYRHLFRFNDLNSRIIHKLETLDIRDHDDLVEAANQIRDLITKAKMPEDLSAEIHEGYKELVRSSGGMENVALRSSAVEEDMHLSLSGQFRSILNVPHGSLSKCYREVLASKFTPRTIYYMLSHSLDEAELGMSVGCLAMIDAQASGVIYTRDPLEPESGTLLVHALYGLGPYVVEGTLTPDVYVVQREPFKILDRRIARKDRQLLLDPAGGTLEEIVPEEIRHQAAVGDDQIHKLAEYALAIEDHFGGPQDIEWAIDRTSGEPVILQSRNLRVVSSRPEIELPPTDHLPVILRGGTTVCPGAGGGKVIRIRSESDLSRVTPGSVLVALNPMPSLADVLENAQALVTEVGSNASHLAAIVREKRIPTITGMQNALTALGTGRKVTVDATTCIVYDEIQDELIKARLPEYDLFEDTAIFELLRKLLDHISPLNLVRPSDPDFLPERCKTLHDLTRFIHQRGIEEVFNSSEHTGSGHYNLLLRSTIPIPVHILDLDTEKAAKRWVNENDIPSFPMQQFWNGVLQEGWPEYNLAPRDFIALSVSGRGSAQESQFTESSFVVIGRDYMQLSLHLGFHFTSLEAMVTENADRNFLRLHYKGGGASADRRRRRIHLVEELLKRMGFILDVKSDFLDGSLDGIDRETSGQKLHKIGRLSMLTKQLDMALSNDRITNWYTEDFAKRLELPAREGVLR